MIDIILIDQHEVDLRSQLNIASGKENAAYVLFGQSEIVNDPWSKAPRTRFVSHAIIPIPEEDKISASSTHVTWSTKSFIRQLAFATEQNFILGIVHSHPNGSADFSSQDDRNEAELARTVSNRNGPKTPLISLIFSRDGEISARIWIGQVVLPVQRISVTGKRLQFFGRLDEPSSTDHLDRQARIFGTEMNDILRDLRIAVVGCGGTGSPVALLLLRLGVGKITLIDGDVLEVTNLNRVHGASANDVSKPKVDVLAHEIEKANLGINVVPIQRWISEPEVRDPLKSCDVIFGCTDDHSGRSFLSRFAYFYGIPIIDVGLKITRPDNHSDFSMIGRVSVVAPGAACLSCRGLIKPIRIAEEDLERKNFVQFVSRKNEAYVEGGGDPAPAVVTFTTEAAAMAVNELLQGLTGYRGADGMAWHRQRLFHSLEDKCQNIRPRLECTVCNKQEYWGRGDFEPFLDRTG